jgi:uncharacterized phage protein (TIGR01671 family)
MTSPEQRRKEKIKGITDTMIRRPILFRAFDTTHQVMAKRDELDGDFDFIKDGDRVRSTLGWQDVFNGDYPDVIPMQFTGLLDKNGKQIWEGDIVEAAWVHKGQPGQKFKAIIFYNQHIGSFRIGYDGMGGGAQDEIYFRYQIEVIGNLYENPELMNPKSQTQPQ